MLKQTLLKAVINPGLIDTADLLGNIEQRIEAGFILINGNTLDKITVAL